MLLLLLDNDGSFLCRSHTRATPDVHNNINL